MTRKYQSQRRKGSERGPYKEEKEKRDQRVSLLLTKEEKEDLERIANAKGLSISELLRELLNSYR